MFLKMHYRAKHVGGVKFIWCLDHWNSASDLTGGLRDLPNPSWFAQALHFQYICWSTKISLIFFLIGWQVCHNWLSVSGAILSSCESEKAITAGLRGVKKLLGPRAFYGRGYEISVFMLYQHVTLLLFSSISSNCVNFHTGENGPQLVMLDDSKAEKSVFNNVYP